MPKRHNQVVNLIEAMPIEAIVVTRFGAAGISDERRRRKCLIRFLYELDSAGCSLLTLESRGPHS